MLFSDVNNPFPKHIQKAQQCLGCCKKGFLIGFWRPLFDEKLQLIKYMKNISTNSLNIFESLAQTIGALWIIKQKY